MNKKVSVIIPVYGVEKYLDRCVNSIIHQTYDNLEIVLIDDGSPDNCPKMCDEWAKRDDRIKVIHKQNGGLSDARNAGLEICTGEYILFVDSDDYIDLTMVEKLLTQLENDNSDICIAHFSKFYDGELPCKKYSKATEVLSTEDALLRLTPKHYDLSFVTAWGKLIKKEIIKNLRFAKGKIHEDEFMCHHLLGNCKKISCTYEPLYFYYINGGGIVNSKVTKSKLDVIEAMKDRIQYVSKEYPNLLPETVQNALETYQFVYCQIRYKGADKEIFDEFRKEFLLLYDECKKGGFPFKIKIFSRTYLFRHFKNFYYLFAKIKNSMRDLIRKMKRKFVFCHKKKQSKEK